jgi:ribosomal protein L37E
MVSSDYRCPKCGVLWDLKYCDECGFENDDSLRRTTVHLRKKEFKRETKPDNKQK